jgi:3-methyladenine DNA glycosylase AlkD
VAGWRVDNRELSQLLEVAWLIEGHDGQSTRAPIGLPEGYREPMQPSLVETVTARLAREGNPERAAQEKRYLKSDLAFLGATVPQIRRVVREIVSVDAVPDHDAVVRLVDALWERPVHECRMAAVHVLERHLRHLGAGDLPLVERLIRASMTWAYVDALAATVAGTIGAADATSGATFDRWARDPDFWVRRAALLSQLVHARSGASLDRFLAYADAMLDEREFFIRKAIGWVLREAGKRQPALVVDWLAPRTGRASGVTMREAVRRLPERDAERLMRAYRDRRAVAMGE